MAVVSIIPLLIILVLVALLSTKGSSISLRHNLQSWLVTGYILLLLAAPALIPLLPAENLADVKMKTVSEMDIVTEMAGQGGLFTQALQGRPEQAEGAFVLEQWQFPCRQDSIINLVENHAYRNGAAENSVTIVVEKKDRADGLMEIVNYATRTIVGGFDFSDRMRMHEVNLDGNVLLVTGPERLKVVLGMFSREFAAGQILGEGSAMFEHSGGIGHTGTIPGSQLLYLRIPADVKVQSEMPVVYVEE
ncbi:MAG: hypothetical protein PHY77_00835 [Desulfotomaculaceae bacterium]|nr:hypothetical protein [Desulfotomaculaceae bacterium]